MEKELLQRIDRKLTELLKDSRQPKPLWVTASIIIEKTGWDNQKMRTAREEGWVKYEKRKNADGTTSLRYDANSLSLFFLKQTA